MMDWHTFPQGVSRGRIRSDRRRVTRQQKDSPRAAEPSIARLSPLFTCSACNGAGLPRRVATRGSASVVIGMVCASCGNDWDLTRTISKDGATTFTDTGHTLEG